MLWILLIAAVAFLAWKFRVKLLAKALGQPERRIERRLDQKRR